MCLKNHRPYLSTKGWNAKCFLGLMYGGQRTDHVPKVRTFAVHINYTTTHINIAVVVECLSLINTTTWWKFKHISGSELQNKIYGKLNADFKALQWVFIVCRHLWLLNRIQKTKTKNKQKVTLKITIISTARLLTYW